MPRTASAAKSARQSEKRRLARQPYKTFVKTMTKKYLELVKEGKKDEAAKFLPTVYKTIDMAAKKNFIHSNTADRRKSRFAKMLKG